MISRREFLRRSILYTLALAGGNSLAACSPKSPTSLPPVANVLPTRTSLPLATSTRAATASSTTPATLIAPAENTPYLVVARGPSPAAITRAAIDALGGISKFVKPGSDVILKPNICNAQNRPEYASTTNPEVLAALVQMCLEAGAKRVRAMDQPFSGTAVEAYKVSGIREAVERAGGQMEIMASAKYVTVDFPNARDIKSWQVYQDILQADAVINVPIAKHHGSARLTLAMKNLMGVITNRNSIHIALDQRIADLSTVIKPTLNVIDGVRVLTRNGPTGGSLDYVMTANTIIASTDIVAADAYATHLLFNKQPQDIGYIKIGADMRLGRSDFENLSVKEVVT
jgi:uncharacterized protein (DUF362 family)